MGDAERRDRLRLIRSDRIGPINFRDLLARFGTASAALAAVSDLARRGGAARPPRLQSAADAEREIAAIARLGGRLVLLGLSLGYLIGLASDLVITYGGG